VPIAPPSVSTRVEADLAADDADDEMPDAEENEEDEPIGPSLQDLPLDQHPAGTNVDVYCTSCHQNVRPTHFNVCPECELTDSTVVLDGAIAEAYRVSKKVNGQYVLSTELRDAIQQNVAKRLLARMKQEPSAEPGGLPPRPDYRIVGIADPDNLTYSRMQSSVSTGIAFRGEEESAALPSVSTGGEDAAMALPVDTTGEGADCSAEEYKEMVDNMMAAKAAAADPLALGEEVPDFGGTSSVHSSPPDIAMAAIDANLKAIRRADRGAPVTSSNATNWDALGRRQCAR
jgi:hypothetical protein